MTLKGEFNDLRKDVALIQSDLVDIKSDLREHIRRTEILESRQESFESLIKSFRDIETTATIIRKVYKPVIFLLCILAGLAGTNQLIDIISKF
jgi:hypothetical protein